MDFSFFQFILGTGLVLFGKRLFWTMIGLAGFVFGLKTAQNLFDKQPLWFSLVIAVICAAAIVGIIRFLKNIAFGLGGFMLGAYLVNAILQLLNLELGTLQWVFIITGGAVGAVLMLTLFNWALIVLSTTAGAMLITQTLPDDLSGVKFIFFGLVLLGLIAQTRKPNSQVMSKTIPGMDQNINDKPV